MAVVLQWVNSNEARLSKTVTSLERAFGSGYLLGELLYKRGMLEKKQYEALVDADDMETALQNFDVVVGALEAAQVPFEKAEIGKVVMRQRGAAAKLLLAIKEIHEKGVPVPPPPKPNPLATVRPKQFLRARLSDWGCDDFEEKTVKRVGFHNWNALDMAIHVRKCVGRRRPRFLPRARAAARARAPRLLAPRLVSRPPLTRARASLSPAARARAPDSTTSSARRSASRRSAR